MTHSPSPQPPPTQRPEAGRVVVLVGFLIALAAGLGAALINPALWRSPDAPLVDGGWATAYQDAFDRELALSAPSKALWSAIDLAVFTQPPAGVLQAGGGWLFTDEEYRLGADPEAIRRRWVELIDQTRTRLAEQGIELLVALVPAKAASLSQVAAPLPRAAAERYDLTLADLRALGVATVDLRPALAGEAAWLRTDTHWTPDGAAWAAEAIATSLSQLVPTMVADHRYVMETGDTYPFHGDLYRLLALGPFAQALGPAPDLLQEQVFLTEADLGADLFTEVSIEVTLVGTSYSAEPTWSLADRLRLAASVDVLDVSEVGRGPLTPMQDYLESEALRNAPPLAVVWELPERYLTDPGFLPGGTDDASTMEVPW